MLAKGWREVQAYSRYNAPVAMGDSQVRVQTPEPVARGGPVAPDLLAGLNPAQQSAVVHTGSPLLILAGAGSGKTRTITRRIAYLMRERGLRPDEILAITFTNKAAREMRERVAALLPATGAWIGTFHSMGARILRRDIALLGGWTSDFTIYDTDDRSRVLKEAVKQAGLDSTRYKPGDIGAWISARKNQVASAPHEASQGSYESDIYERIARSYEETMRRNNALDFDDLLLKVLELFAAHPGVRDLYARRFREVLVDEYQDTNGVQYRWLRELSKVHGAVTVCGDPDQSIYAWRGADVRNILEFERDFPGALVVRLEQNYRSRQRILSAAQTVIRNNRGRRDKDLWSDRGPGERLCVLSCADEDDEGHEIAAQIKTLVANGVSADQVAVFYRVNFMQRALERALRLASIPYTVVAGTEFYQRREIKDLIAWLRLLVNPGDGEAAKRALGAPGRGIGEKTLEQLSQWALDRRVSLLRACASTEARSLARGRAKAGLEGFAHQVERLSLFRSSSAGDALRAVVEDIGYFQWLEKDAQDDGVDRAANVEELLAHATSYDAQNPDGGLRGFLQDIALVSDTDAAEPGGPRVSLMTLHSAKGLEFDCAFIAGLEEDLLPHARALAQDPDGPAGSGLEEERRLFYVGMTRARERLFLSHAVVRRHFGSETFTLRSRFLEELPAELVEGMEPDSSEPDLDHEDQSLEPEPNFAFAAGDWVEHDHFGTGQVESLAGSGINARANVRFGSHGTKQLMLQYAKLRLVERVQRTDRNSGPAGRRSP